MVTIFLTEKPSIRFDRLEFQYVGFAPGGDLRVSLVGGSAPVRIDLRLEEVKLRREAGHAQHLPQVRGETLVAVPAKLAFLYAAFDLVA